MPNLTHITFMIFLHYHANSFHNFFNIILQRRWFAHNSELIELDDSHLSPFVVPLFCHEYENIQNFLTRKHLIWHSISQQIQRFRITENTIPNRKIFFYFFSCGFICLFVLSIFSLLVKIVWMLTRVPSKRTKRWHLVWNSWKCWTIKMWFSWWNDIEINLSRIFWNFLQERKLKQFLLISLNVLNYFMTPLWVKVFLQHPTRSYQ